VRLILRRAFPASFKLLFLPVILITLTLTTATQAQRHDAFVKKSCERAAKVSIKLGFRYNDIKPYGLFNFENWGVDWSDVVTLCIDGNECGPIRATFDKYARRADKLVYRFMADNSYSLVCYVDRPSDKYYGRTVSMLLCNPENPYGCIPICDNIGGATYSCKTGREH